MIAIYILTNATTMFIIFDTFLMVALIFISPQVKRRNKKNEVVENYISKNIGVLYRASHLLDFKNLLKIYFSFIHIYISYANIAWARTLKLNSRES